MISRLLLVPLATLTAMSGCANIDDVGSATAQATVIVASDITTDTTWNAINTYVLQTDVFVKNATLTIEDGTTILGAPASSLVVTTSGRIRALGTALSPIVFTSAQQQGTRAPGDWGGLVLLGRAPINATGGINHIEGRAASPDTEYGGTNASHNCGTLNFVRIEFAGYLFGTDNELNGLTLGGCGTLTDLDFIQVHQGQDDGIEFFGGAANLKHAVITQAADDSLDWDEGYQGQIQFLIAQQGAGTGDRAIEADNDSTNPDVLPRSRPEIWNATLIGSNGVAGVGASQMGMKLRRGTGGHTHNSIVAYFKDESVDVDGVATAALWGSDLHVSHTMFFDNGPDNGFPPELGANDDDGGFSESAAFTAPGVANDFVSDPLLVNPLDVLSPNFAPQAMSPALSGGEIPPTCSFFDTTATYRGAIGSEDWTVGWTAYPAN